MSSLTRDEIEETLMNWAKDFTDPQCPDYVSQIEKTAFEIVCQLLDQLDSLSKNDE